MKPINEIRYILCLLSVGALLHLDGGSVPDGWAGLVCWGMLILGGIGIGSFLTALLIAFKKWWRE